MPARDLTRAAKAGNIEGVRRHIRYAGCKDAEGQTALMKAVEVRSSACIDLLLPVEGNMQDNRGWTALMRAADNGDSYIAGKLLCEARRQSWKKKTVFPPGTTALMIATYRRAPRVVELLKPYEEHLVDHKGHTASWYACNNPSFTLSTLSRNPPATGVPLSSFSLFNYSMITRPSTSTTSLITTPARSPVSTSTSSLQRPNGFIPSFEDDEQQDFQRALEGDILAQRRVQSHSGAYSGANTSVSETSQINRYQNNDGINNSPPHVKEESLCASGHEVQASQASDMSTHANPMPLSPLITAATNGDPNEVRKHISHVGECDTEGRTALMYAAVQGHKAVVRLLAGLEARTQDRLGRTALMYAAQGGWAESVQLLLDEADLRDAEGMTALDFAEAVTEPLRLVVRCTWCACIIRRHLRSCRSAATKALSNMLEETHIIYNALNGLLTEDEAGFAESTLTTVFEGVLALKELAEKKEAAIAPDTKVEKLGVEEFDELSATRQALEEEWDGLSERLKGAEEEIQEQEQKLLNWETWSEEFKAYCDGIVAERDELQQKLEALQEEIRLPKKILSCAGYSLEELDQLKEVLTGSLQAVTSAQGALQATSCVVCLSSPKNTLLQPCKHICVCSECAEKMRSSECPICRRRVEGVELVFI